MNEKIHEKAVSVKDGLMQYFKGEDEIIDMFLAGIFSESKILLHASPGKGKSLLAETTAELCNTSYARVQGSSGLTESKLLARYDIAKLMKGEEEVNWRKFVSAHIKLLDEVNRCHPVILSSIFTMLQEKMAIYGDERYEVPDYAFIATMNPADGGTYTLSPPLVDRFDFCLRLSSVTFYDKITMLNGGRIDVDPVLKEGDLEKIWADVKKVEVPMDIKVLLAGYVRDLQLCVHGEKEFLTNFPSCCTECRFNNWICSDIDNRYPISERAYLSSLKVAKALAYLGGRDEIGKDDAIAVFKTALLHRLYLTDTYMQQYPTQSKAVDSIINKLLSKDKERGRKFKLVREVSKNATPKGLEDLKKCAQEDMLIDDVYKQIQAKLEKRVEGIDEKLKTLSPEELEKWKTKLEKKEGSEHEGLLANITAKLEDYVNISTTVTTAEYLGFVAKSNKISRKLSKELREKLEDTNIEIYWEGGRITGIRRDRTDKVDLSVYCKDIKTARKVRRVLGMEK